MAIGDGANDVNMIQSAHVGVGLQGKEGTQASSFADYSLPKFRDLRQLILWHGTSFSVRATNFSCWFLYKGMLFSIPLIFFNIHAAFSGLTYVEDYYYALYEVILTTWAICFYLFIEVDVHPKYKSSENTSNFLADYYHHAREVIIQPLISKLMNWCLYAWLSGFILFYVSFFTYGHYGGVYSRGIINQDGKTDGVWTAGFASFTILILVHHIIIFISTRNYTIYIAVAYIFSLLCFMPITILLNETTSGTMMYKTTFSDILSTPLYWTIVILGTTAIVIPFYFVKQYDELFRYPVMYGNMSEEAIEAYSNSRKKAIDEKEIERMKRREARDEIEREEQMRRERSRNPTKKKSGGIGIERLGFNTSKPKDKKKQRS